MLAADNWCVKVEERIYGPYTSQQLRKFAHEGRFAPWSLVAPAGSRSWREARNEGSFAAFFVMDARRGLSGSRTFGKRDFGAEPVETAKAEAPVNETATTTVLEAPVEEQPRVSAPQLPMQGNSGPAATTHHEPRIANFIMIFDIVSAAASRVEAAVLSLGPAFRVAENVWTVSCEMSAVGVRNAIAPYLLPRESLLVVDATRGRTSWQNFAPELHAKLSAAWAASRQ